MAPASARLWSYRFLLPGEVEVERGEFPTDAEAEERGRALSGERRSPVVIERHSAHVDDWEYVIEVGS